MIESMTTVHGRRRLQQRAVPPLVVGLLEEFGSSVRAHGAERLIFDKAARKRLKHHLGGERGIRVVEPWLSVYAVVNDDGYLITVAHQHQRHRRA